MGTPRAPAGTGVAPDAEAWMVFGMRLLLAVAALLTLYVGLGGAVLEGPLWWFVFVLYGLHSLVLLCVANLRAGFWHGPVVYWVDVGWYALMVYATGGSGSPFFSFFFFAILAASFRHGFDTGARLTLCSAALGTLAVLAVQGFATLNLLLLRATFMLALGYMVAFWGGLAVDQRRRLALLRDVSRLSNPRFGVQHTLDSLMEKVLRYYGGTSCVLLMRDADGASWHLNTVHHPSARRPVSRTRADAVAVQPLLAPAPGAVLLFGSAPPAGLRRVHALQADDERHGWHAADRAMCGHIADLLDAPGFISAPLPLRKGAGRIFVTGERLRRGDATFLRHIVQQAFPVIETIDLLDRLASDAAFRERRTIARDLHDSTIQPYIGLRHAVAAIRSRAGDDNVVASDLDHLLQMCADTIADMRQFAQRFRNGRQQEAELLIALRRQLSQVRTFYDVDVTLEAEGVQTINDRMAAQVFQIVTEAVSNVCKHTSAKSARVRLAEEDGQIAIDVANPHDGGSRPAPFRPASIAERVQELGGTLDVDTEAHDTRLRIRVPI